MKHSDSIAAIAPAYIAAQAKIEKAAKDATNPHFNKRYADLASVVEACKGPLNEQGIAFIQTPMADEQAGRLTLTTRLIHKSGEWFEGTITMPLVKNDPQAYGSALTYARRYGLAAITGVCPDDDDGEGAVDRTQQPNRQPQPKALRPPAKVPAKGASEATVSGDPVPETELREKRADEFAKLMDSLKIDESTRKAYVKAVCNKFKVTRITDLPQDTWDKMIANIKSEGIGNKKAA